MLVRRPRLARGRAQALVLALRQGDPMTSTVADTNPMTSTVADTPYLTPAQVAELLQVSTKTVSRWSLEDASMPVTRLPGAWSGSSAPRCSGGLNAARIAQGITQAHRARK